MPEPTRLPAEVIAVRTTHAMPTPRGGPVARQGPATTHAVEGGQPPSALKAVYAQGIRPLSPHCPQGSADIGSRRGARPAIRRPLPCSTGRTLAAKTLTVGLDKAAALGCLFGPGRCHAGVAR